MKNLQLRFTKYIIHMLSRTMIVLLALGLLGRPAYSNPPVEGITAPSVTICGEQSVVLHVTSNTYTGGALNWYSVPYYGTSIGTGADYTTPVLAQTTTYYVDYVIGGVGICNRVPVTVTLSTTSIVASVFYPSGTYCNSLDAAQTPTITGSTGGAYSVTPTGSLVVDPNTGVFNPHNVNPGTYTIKYHITNQSAGCTEEDCTTPIVITNALVQPTISYSGSPYCTSHDAVTVTQTGAAGGTYSASPSGLTINSGDGTITPSTSLSGHYTISYFVPGAGGCSPQTAQATVDVLQLPTATISYSSATFTKNQGSQAVTLTGTGVYTGGSFTKTAGAGTLALNSSTGAIDPSASDAGTYTITYTLAAVSPCAQVTTIANVTILSLPTATIGGTNSVCANSGAHDITFTGANGAEPYTFTYKVNGGFEQTVTTTSGSSVTVSQSTGTPGTFAYSLVSVTDANSSTQTQDGTATITVNVSPVALFGYPGSPYCSDGTNPSPTFIDGGTAGTFSSTAGLVFVSTATGQIDLSASTAGNYTVTNTIAAANGCSEVVATASVTITKLPVATFSYAGSSYCPSVTPDAVPTISAPAVAGVFTANDLAVVFKEGGSPGTIDVVLTPAGDYTITNTVIAANGCAQVTETALITVQAAPSMTTPRNFTICSGTSPNIALTSSSAGATFTWTLGTNTGGIVGASAGSGGSGTSINQTLTNPSNSINGSIEYIVTPTIGAGACGTGLPYKITVTVKPTPQLSSTPTPTAICSGSTFAYTATSDAAVPSFAWTRATVDGITEAAVNNGTGNVNETLTNTTNAPIDVTYVYVTTANGCSNSAQNVVVWVNPKPQGSLTANGPFCATGAGQLTWTKTAGTGPYTIVYKENGGADRTASDVVSGTPFAVFTTPVTSTTTYTLVSVTDANCDRSSGFTGGSATITVNPLPAAPTAGNVTTTYDGLEHTGTATPPEGSHVVWYDAASGSNTTVAPQGINFGTYTAWAESVDNTTSCVSATRTQVTVTISKAALTITANDVNKTYGDPLTGAAGSSAFTSSGLQNGETIGSVTIAYGTGSAADAEVGTNIAQVTASAAIGGTFTASNYTITYDKGAIIIGAKALTVTGASVTTKPYDGNTTAAITGATLTGIVGTENVTLGNATAGTFAQATPGTGISVSTTMSISGTDAGNYTLTQPTLTGTITPDAPTGASAQTFCSADNKKVSDLVITGTGIIWYDAATGGNVVAGTTALVTGTTYYASQTVSSSESATRLAVTVTITTAVRYYQDSDGDSYGNPAVHLDACTPPAGYVTNSLDCDDANVAIHPVSVAAIGGGAANVCVGATTPAFTDATSGGTWSIVPGGTGTASIASDGKVTGSTAGTVTIKYTADDWCGSNATTTVTVNAIPDVPTGTAAQTYCSGTTVASLIATGTNIQWYTAETGGSALATTTVLVDATDYWASQTANGCESSARFKVTVTVQSVTAAPVITSSIINTDTSVSGTSTEADGTSIEIFKGATSLGTTTVSSGAWTKSGLTLTSGDVITAKATATGKCVSDSSLGITVQ